MAIQKMKVKFTGFSPMLQNNPQTVDPFNGFARLKKPLTSKRSKTEEDLLEIRRIETESKIFFDDDVGVYVPARWVSAAIAQNSWKLEKISKADVRGAVFIIGEKVKLNYRGMRNVKTPRDISVNNDFTTVLILPQQRVRIAKSFPIFHDWSFEVEVEFDDEIIDAASLVRILEHSGKYGGFGDFRPTYGRASMEVLDD